MNKDTEKSVWIAVYTKSRHEKTANDEFMKKGIESYLPLIKTRVQWKDRKKWVWKPLFRSYIFVKILLKNTLYVLQTYGVHHIVKFNGKPAVVSDDQIEAVKLILEGGYHPDLHEYLEVGDEVEIIDGPLRGLRGILSRKDRRTRFVLKLDGIQQALSLEISQEFLKKVKK